MRRLVFGGAFLLLGACGDSGGGDSPVEPAAAGGAGAGGVVAGQGGDAGAGQAGDGAGGMAPTKPPFVADPKARTRLSEAGFFADLESRRPAADLVEFEPRFPLWSDGADKKRWVWLPPGTKVDATDPEHWQFPVGTRFYKEFSRDGKRLETRLVERTGEGRFDFWMGAFIWLEDQSDAVFAKDGARDVLGTRHDVPDAEACESCHNGEPGRALGFSAMQLAGTPAFDLDFIAPKPAAVPGPPGDPTARAALGYLHANCGFCHYDGGIAWKETDMYLRLSLGETSVESSAAYLSTVGKRVQFFQNNDIELRVDPSLPNKSALWFRMSYRGDDEQMPPIATEIVDDEGIEAVRAWIASLPAAEPGPGPQPSVGAVEW
jgi:hypothetical protein